MQRSSERNMFPPWNLLELACHLWKASWNYTTANQLSSKAVWGQHRGIYSREESCRNNTVILHLYLLLIFLSKCACVILGSLLQIEIEGIMLWYFCLAHEQTDPNAPQLPSHWPKNVIRNENIYETWGLEIRLSSSSTRSPGILSKILLFNLCFKVANYAQSWFHGHSCTALPSQSPWLAVVCCSFSAQGDCAAYLGWCLCHWDAQWSILADIFISLHSQHSNTESPGLHFYSWCKKFMM